MEANNNNNSIETIPVTNLCIHYKIETAFFERLESFGLINLIHQEQTPAIAVESIKEIERWIHLHYDLNINMEGLDAISHILQRMEILQTELAKAKSRLRSMEGL